MLRLRWRLVLSTASFLVALGIFLGIFGWVRWAGRDAAFRDAQAAYGVIVELVSEAASSGYFQWTEFHDAVAGRDMAHADADLKNLIQGSRFVKTAWVAPGTPPAETYREVGTATTLLVELAITNSDGTDALTDRIGVVGLDASRILKVVQARSNLELDSAGQPFYRQLRVIDHSAVWRWTDAVWSGLFAILAALGPWVAFRREDRFFYEAKGLDTIIFLFENNEAYSAHHSRRVAELTVALGKKLGYRGRKLRDLRIAALLHDIGKISVPQEILTKTARLTWDERTKVEAHAEASGRILEYFSELAHLAPVVRAHHEKMDGTGYPRGLRGDEIPFDARIIAVADVFEALTGNRPYRTPLPAEQALEILRGMSLERRVVEALELHLRKLHGAPVFSESVRP